MTIRTPQSAIRIRDFQVDDQSPARALILAGLREHWGEDFDPAQNPDLDDIGVFFPIPIPPKGDILCLTKRSYPTLYLPLS